MLGMARIALRILSNGTNLPMSISFTYQVQRIQELPFDS